MADVFLSYARADRTAAERLAHLIGEAGLSVWWDRHIKGGAEYSRDIEHELDTAARVLVLWSKEAVKSRWVRDEASVAADSGRLVGASIDKTPPPLGFRQFQTIDLQKWATKGAAIPPEFLEALDIDAPARAVRQPFNSRRPRRRLIAAGAFGLLVAGAATVAIVRPDPIDRLFSGQTRGEQLSLAIMPFVTPGGAEISYLGPGLSTALANSLTPLSGLRITASTSTQAIARKGLTAPQIGETLGITHLVEGDVQKIGERYSISLRLVEARTSEQIWARSFESGGKELQALKSRMARELAGALRARLGVGQGEIAERGDVDPRAYSAYLRALERVSVRDQIEARVEAIEQFRLAASIQPNFADAHAGYAYLVALTNPELLGMSWAEAATRQRLAAERALNIDPENDLALVAKATGLQNFNGDVLQSIALNEQVLRRSPDFGPAHYSLAAELLMAGQTRKALEHIDRAIDGDPFDMLFRGYRSYILYTLGDYRGVRNAAINCGDGCGRVTRWWFLALIGFATPAQYREDLPLFLNQLAVQGWPRDDVPIYKGVADALILGEPYTPAKLQDEREMTFANAAIAARLIGFEEGLHYARVAADKMQAGSIVELLNGGRVTFTPEQRSDPRYHRLFEHPKLRATHAARRKAGVTAGLPVFPVRTYTGR